MRRLYASVVIALCCFVLYLANGRGITAADAYSSRYLPFAILKYRTVFLNPVADVARQGQGDLAFWMLQRPDGRIMSLYPVTGAVLLSPLYVPAVAYLDATGWSPSRFDWVAKVMEKVTASFVASLSVALLFILLRRRATAFTAWSLTIAYALGTTTWVISSQAFWQHGLAQLLVVAALLLLTGESTPARAAIVGLLCGLLACNRPPDLLLAAALGLYALYWAGWRRWALLAVTAALPMLVVLYYNLEFGGNVAGGYGVTGRARFFSNPLFPGIAGLLFSPARGLFVFSPFLLFLGLGFRLLPRTRDDRRLAIALVAGAVAQLLLYAKADWRGGLSWGPRYMTDLLPFLILLLVPVIERLGRAGRVCFVAAVAVSVAIQAIGAFCWWWPLDSPIYAQDRGEDADMRPAWRLANASFVAALRNGPIAPDLWRETRGTFDALESDGRPVTGTIVAGQTLTASGWALAGSHTPAQVAVMVDGAGGFAQASFTPRPDVRAALGEASPSGWSVVIDTSKLSPGEHRLTAVVWPSLQTDHRYLDARTIVVRPNVIAADDDDLRDDRNVVLARLREGQQPDGYWLTSYTAAPRFVNAAVEVNTFLTAMLIDLLGPVGGDTAPLVERARVHLRKQIEPGGLVRYHGRPDSPWIGTLCCAITPDTDDTALAWRIAPAADRRELDRALATIEQYRTDDGLYRSWLAAREDYRCLDPGDDPNPTDIAIQMHLLMLLSAERPAASGALCRALGSRVDEDSIWVYYERTPLVPMLRTRDLREAGCPIALPASRTRTDVEGQADWLWAARLLDPPANGPVERDVLAARELLRRLARSDFALLRSNPPLLYHNDLTATVPRYYWSEHVGYALWLRLHELYERPNLSR